MFRASIVHRYATLADSSAARWREAESWLTSAERVDWSRLRHPLRSKAWLCARWLGKQLVCGQHPQATPSRVEIRSCRRDGRPTRPRVFLDDREWPGSLSISHSDRGVWVVLCSTPGTTIGVDLVEPFPASPGFLRTWFTCSERQWLLRKGTEWAAVLWAAKEAFYKAVNAGERFRPRQIELRPLGAASFVGRQVVAEKGRTTSVHVQLLDGHFAAMAMIGEPSCLCGPGADDHLGGVQHD